jgi:arylsulfatase A-like enzyme
VPDRRRPRPRLLVLAAVAAAALPAGARPVPAAATADPRPNVVVVMTDDEAVGNQWVMAATNRLVGGAKGTTFAEAVVSYPLCCPSRATFLTGQYSHNHGVVSNQAPDGGYCALDPTDTLPVWLHEAGYATAQVGKYLNQYGRCRPPDVPPGWDDWFAWISSPDNGSYFDYTVDDDGEVVAFGHAEEDYSTDVFARHAVDVIRARAAAPEPFFLLFEPHAPHSVDPVPAPRHAGALDGVALPTPPSFNEADVSDKPTFVSTLPLLDARDVADARDAYERRLEALLAVDEAVAAIVGALRDTGELRDTVIVFTSDNGFLQGQHRIEAGKVHAYEESIRVPLLVRGGPFPAGATVSPLVANVDLAATIVELAGAVPGHPLDGRSLVPIATDPGAGLGRQVLIESSPTAEGGYRGVRTPRYAFVQYHDGQRELYDLDADPYQLENRAGDPAYAEAERRLAGALARLATCAGATCVTGS